MQHTHVLCLVVATLSLGAAACSKRQPEGDRPAGLPASGAPAAPAAPPVMPPPPPVDDQMVAAPPDAKHSISGSITLPAARKRDVAPTDTVFIIARRAGGPPGPGSMLAVQRHLASQFPLPFTLSARDAMIPGTPFEGAINITVRLDRDGDGLTRKKGDLYGQVNDIRVGSQEVAIPLDSVQTEDQTLAGGAVGQGGPAPGGGKPPGHP